MNHHELESAALTAANHCLKTKGHISLVEVFVKMGRLSRQHHDDWRMGRTPYLEKVIQLNLSQINLVCRAVHRSAAKGKLKPSWTAYVQWGKGARTPLRFTKSADPKLERLWATHYLMVQCDRKASVVSDESSGQIPTKPADTEPPAQHE